ncbi:RNA exonuclease 4 [Abortiporus biennis]
MVRSTKAGPSSSIPSNNWLALSKRLPTGSSTKTEHVRKKRKLDNNTQVAAVSTLAAASVSAVSEPTSTPGFFDFNREPRSTIITTSADDVKFPSGMKNGEDLNALARMVLGYLEYDGASRRTGKFLAIDCEMVGVGIEGKESSLARVSIVNYSGAVVMDEFVRQKEQVVDYRTQWSGIRPRDMIKAKPFEAIQKQVANIIENRVLIGHAVQNDLKALLLSHPRNLLVDTQVCAGTQKITNSRKPALKHLVHDQLQIAIQDGEHDSVTDARATMAIYRLYRKEWNTLLNIRPPKELKFDDVDTTIDETPSAELKGTKMPGAQLLAVLGSGPPSPHYRLTRYSVTPIHTPPHHTSSSSFSPHPNQGRKGISSGLSTIVIQKNKSGGTTTTTTTTKRKSHRFEPKSDHTSHDGKRKLRWWESVPEDQHSTDRTSSNTRSLRELNFTSGPAVNSTTSRISNSKWSKKNSEVRS